jgi:N-acetylglucosaminyldiphosphoundecaprenol N-acetyl-beta-D-mannosaminyltransferase
MDAVTPGEVLGFTAACIADRKKAVVANHNAHSLHLVRRSPEMAALYARADLIQIDSVPLIAWGRLLGHKLSRRRRSTYLDWREAFWNLAQVCGWRVFHLGGQPGVGERAREEIGRRHAGAVIGVRHGYFDVTGPENDEVLAEIGAFKPDVLFVGMGMPRQEAWIAANYERLPDCVIFPVGAAFDFEAGAQKTPPRWSGRMGVEWLWRFGCEPRRLFARYFVEPWSLVGAAAQDLKAHRVSKA